LSEVLILAVDTALGACSAAVLQSERVLARRHVVMERGHAEVLAPMVEEVMVEAGLAFGQLEKLAVTTGPGTFTGQRVGLAFMRGLRVALQKPLAGVTTLAAMAEQARSEAGCAIAAAVHDAKRGEVYLEAIGRPLSARVVRFEEAVELLRVFDGLVLAGTAAARMAEALNGVRVMPIIAPDAVWVARLAAEIEPTAAPRPLYLRAPDAKLPAKR
jgi:tRNA threonylcarbamoyladenosine biosynthesis protein TsaB